MTNSNALSTERCSSVMQPKNQGGLPRHPQRLAQSLRSYTDLTASQLDHCCHDVFHTCSVYIWSPYVTVAFVQAKCDVTAQGKTSSKGAPGANLTCKTKPGQPPEAPTPAKSPLLAADDVDCIPDTPDEGSASKAVHAALASPAVPKALASAADAVDAAVVDAPASTAVVVGMAVRSAPALSAVLADAASLGAAGLPAAASNIVPVHATRMVPESPDQASLPGLSPEAAVSQPQSSTPMPLQEPNPTVAPHVEQHATRSQGLHLSLGLHNSEDAAFSLNNSYLPLPEVQQNMLSTADAAAADLSVLLPGVAPVSVAGGAKPALATAVDHPAKASLLAAGASAGVTAVASVPAAADVPHVNPAAESATAPPASSAAAYHVQDKAAVAAAEAAVTPASSKHAAEPLCDHEGQSVSSLLNDSALMAALDSAERKVMQVGFEHFQLWRLHLQ